MPINSFSIGRDCQLVLIGPAGRLDLAYVTGFECQQMTQKIRVEKLDGTLMAAELPKGWEGHFDLERGSSAAEDFIAAAEAAYFSGGAVPYGTMYQYINEVDGSVSTYQFDSVVFKLASAGLWKGDQAVKQKLEFFAARRQRV
jgi:hypothetical protein